MPFIAPIIVGAIGLTGIAATIGTAVIGTAIAAGVGYGASRLFAPRTARADASISSGVQLSLQMDPNAPRQLAMGQTAVGGSLTYWQFSGANNTVLEMVITVNDWPSGAFKAVWVDGARKTINGSGHVDGYGDSFTITYYNGSFTQTADAGLVSRSGGDWTSNHKLAGCTYVIVKFVTGQDRFTSGLPSMAFEFEGCKLYDPRDGAQNWSDVSTWQYSNNPSVIAYNWRRGFWYNGVRLYGMSTPASYIKTSTYITAANICDETVTKADASTEKRYTYNGLVDTSKENKDNLATFLLSCAGRELESRGFYSFFAGAAKTISLNITEQDLIVNSKFKYTGKRSGAELTNAVFGSFSDPATAFQMRSLPGRVSSTDETTDGGRKSVEQTYGYVTSPTQAQRLMEITRRLARQQGECLMRVRSKLMVLEPDDWVTVSIDRRGWVNKLFTITTVSRTSDGFVQLTLREIAASCYAFNSATDELTDTTQGSLTAGDPTLSVLSGLTGTAIEVEVNSTIKRPGIRAEWNVFNDPTVTSIDIEYRVVGTMGAPLTKTIYNPVNTSFVWVDGIQSAADYEIRAKPITTPSRNTNWTSWIDVDETTINQVVPIAMDVVNVPAAELSAQERFELSLATQLTELTGSSQEVLERAYEWAERAAEESLRNVIAIRGIGTRIRTTQLVLEESDRSLAQQITTVSAELDASVSAIQIDINALVTENTSQANAITSLNSTVGSLNSTVGGHASNISSINASLSTIADVNTAQATAITNLTSTVGTQTTSISTINTTINGLNARWGISINSNGRVTGLVTLDSTNSTSVFAVQADKFIIVHPTVNGTTLQAFITGLVNGVSTIGINGNLLVDGTILARHIAVTTLSAIVANIGTVTAGRLQNSTNTNYFDLTTGEFQITAA